MVIPATERQHADWSEEEFLGGAERARGGVMDLKALQKEAHAIAKEHGWWDQERSFGDCIADVHQALSKALEAYREHGLEDMTWHPTSERDILDSGFGLMPKPEGVASELADVVIRVADMAEWYEVDVREESIEFADDLWLGSLSDQFISFGDWIGGCHILLSDALLELWTPPQKTLPSPWVSLALLLRDVQRMAAHYGIDLNAAIEAKMEYNRTRSYRHGGKAL